MVVPVLWKLGIAAATGVAALALNQTAKSRETKADAIQGDADRKRSLAAESFGKQQERLSVRITEKRDNVKALLDACEARTRPIFESYNIDTGNATDWALPPGFERIENIEVPPLTKGYSGYISSAAGDKKISDTVGMVIQAHINHNKHLEFKEFLNPPRSNLPFSLAPSGPNWSRTVNPLVTGGLIALGSTGERFTTASERLTQARERLAEAEKITIEVEGLEKTFEAILARADVVVGKAMKMKPFFDHFVGPCEAIHRSGRVRDALEDGEWLTIQHLARVSASLAAVAKEPLA